MVFIDTHTHLYAREFDADRDDMIRRAMDAGVERLMLPAIDLEYHEQMLDLCAAWPGVCLPMMGLHPTSVKENFREELAVVAEYLARKELRFYAVGEVGIDLYWDKTREAEQREAFDFQIDLALKYNLPLVIHTRNSMDIALDMVEARKEPGLRGIFHCFSGNVKQAERAVGLGFLLGIGGVVTYKNSGLQQVVEHIGLEHLVLETDAPWLPPVPHRGERNEPSYLPFVAAKISEIKHLPAETVAAATTANALRIFVLNQA